MKPVHFRLAAALAAAWLCCAAPAAAQATFAVSFAPSASVLTASERAALTSHFQEAGRRWTRELVIAGPRSIEIEIAINNVIPRVTGRSQTSAFVGVIGGRDTFEQGMAAELRSGNDPNGAIADVLIDINLAYLRSEMWFDPAPSARTDPVPANLTDAVSLALHEIGHALAYNGFASGNGMPPATFWSPFDRWMIPGTPTFFNGPMAVPAWGSLPDLTTNNIFHWSNESPAPSAAVSATTPVRWRAGVPVPGVACEGPRSVDAPPSASPPARAMLGGRLLDELMNGVVFFRGRRYYVSSLDVAVLSDVGLPANLEDLFANSFEPVAP